MVSLITFLIPFPFPGAAWLLVVIIMLPLTGVITTAKKENVCTYNNHQPYDSI